MSIGLLALLDDVASLTAKAGAKAAGAVIDDAAMTPKAMEGLSAVRELPVIGRIALGSLKNKLLILLPSALALSWLLPWAIGPLLMLGGAYLCYEGAEKLLHPGHANGRDARDEDGRVASAIQTDFILSAEIMAITLSAIPADQSFWMRAAVLAAVGVGITLLVYGAVALLVKADDAGLALTRRHPTGGLHTLGRVLLVGMPWVLRVLAVVGTAAMLWVGGGIVLHGMEGLGFAAPAHGLEVGGLMAGRWLPWGGEWMAGPVLSAAFGLVLGAMIVALGKLLRRSNPAPEGHAASARN